MGFVKCNVCGSDDYEIVFPKGYAQIHRIVRCRRCGLMYANPQEHVDCEDYATGSPVEEYDPEDEANKQYYQKQLVQIPDSVRALRVLNKLFPGRGHLLEVGSHAGTFLNRIRADGWQVVGLEPFRPLANFARKKYGLEIIDGILPNPALPSGHFDAVVMLHVIEHMPDPAENIRELRRVLKPRGVLVVETPRFNSLSFKILGRHERSIQNCPGHIYFFTEQSLRRTFESNGFKVFRVERVGRTLTLDRFFSNVGLVTRCAALRQWFSKIGRYRLLQNTRIHLNIRDMQRMYGVAN
jgi:SAM-dependent methyltransferase